MRENNERTFRNKNAHCIIPCPTSHPPIFRASKNDHELNTASPTELFGRHGQAVQGGGEHRRIPCVPGHPKTCSHSNSCRQVICLIKPSIVVFVPVKKCCSNCTFKQPLYRLINYSNLIQQNKLDTGIYRSPSFFGAEPSADSEFLHLLRISEFFSFYIADFWQTF